MFFVRIPIHRNRVYEGIQCNQNAARLISLAAWIGCRQAPRGENPLKPEHSGKNRKILTTDPVVSETETILCPAMAALVADTPWGGREIF
jgi:hypothetical protein